MEYSLFGQYLQDVTEIQKTIYNNNHAFSKNSSQVNASTALINFKNWNSLLINKGLVIISGDGMHFLRIVSALLILVSTSQAKAYEIEPKKALHEAITAAAIDCISRAENQMPTNCSGYVELIGDIEKTTPKFSIGELEKSTRWADDPTRQIKDKTLLKFGFNAKFNCPRLVRRNGAEAWQVGLLCSSHYGKLQFFHAMASEPGEDFETTLAKVSDWADFLYQITTDQISVDQDYCKFWDENKSSISSAFRPANFGYCISKEKPTGWKLSTIFSMRCKKAFTSTNCTEATGMAARRLSKSAAKGALLHMVQDSYSTSHAARGLNPIQKDFESIIECTYPKSFFDYSKQESSDHSLADQAPTLGASCVDGAEAHDVVTASASIIWMIENKSPVADFNNYFRAKVMGPS